MAKSRRRPDPKTFLLNEQHELSRGEKTGGGRLPNLAAINWASKAEKISDSLETTAKKISTSNDPIKEQRYFFLANPVEAVEKLSKDKKKAPDGVVAEETSFGKQHSRVFSRLGLDLIEVTEQGAAIVHSSPEKFDQLASRVGSLDTLGSREQSRWATLDSFDIVPVQLRVDSEWLSSIKSDETTDAIVELQPLLTRIEFEVVMRAISDLLVDQAKQRLTGMGTDYSGRHWLRGRMGRKLLRTIAKDFFSVQSLHSPLYSLAAIQKKAIGIGRPQTVPSRVVPDNMESLPCVAVFDSGIPAGHQYLATYRRGQFTAPDVTGGPGDHGSMVASRVVFGEQDFTGGIGNIEHLRGDCRFLDVNVSGGFNSIHDKSVFDGLRGVVGAFPDVRVFNFSFGAEKPLARCTDIERRERLLMVQDLDNFIFANDVIVVVASGNSPHGVTPEAPYPDHLHDMNWQLGHWAMGFNSMVCGATVGHLSADGLVKTVGWPSPFTRIGPGICDAPVPGFSAPGGNTDENYRFSAGLGVWVCTHQSMWEDRIGTSFAAPLLAREAAFACNELQQFCPSGTQPFGVTLKAFLAITAEAPYTDDTPSNVRTLCDRTVGRGKASNARLREPHPGSAIYLWQGVLDSSSDTANVQIPIPKAWYNEASNPILRIVTAADVPVNEAVRGLWASRKISLKLYPGPDSRALHPMRRRGQSHASYPLTERVYNLRRLPDGTHVDGDMWLAAIDYEEIADYYPNVDFDSQQRVAIAAELLDEGEAAVSPQAAIQSLPVAVTMNRFSVPVMQIRNPIIIKSRV